MGLSLNWWWTGDCRQEVGRVNTDGSKFLVLNVVVKSLAKKEADSGAQVVVGSGVIV